MINIIVMHTNYYTNPIGTLRKANRRKRFYLLRRLWKAITDHGTNPHQ